MKKKLCFMMLIAVSISISAQLKVESTGKVAIQRTTQNNKSSLCVGDLGYSTFDYGNFSVGVESQGYTSSASSTAVGVSGEASNVNTTQNSSMAIGVWGEGYGIYSNYNIGVFGTVHLSETGAGIYGTDEGGPYGTFPSGSYAGYFFGNTYVDGDITVTNGLYNLLDNRLISNVRSLSFKGNRGESALENLQGLNVISYNLDSPTIYNSRKKGDAESKISDRKLAAANRRHYGLSVEDLQKIYPDLVCEGQDGYLTVNYTELVPILIHSIQELKQELDEVKGSGSKMTRSAFINEGTDRLAEATNVLYQNIPNPFKEQTIIRFSLADDVQDAFICIFDMTGKMLRKLPISSGATSVNVNGWELGEGLFLYTLMVNGKEVDTKKMIITR